MNLKWYEQSSAQVSAEEDWLSPWERPRLWSLHIAKRRGDWRLGRWTAKYAAADYLNLPHDPATFASIEIVPAASGAPEVFLNGTPARLSISLSHRDGIAACAVGAPGAMFGCDLEIVEERSDAFVSDYFTAAEQKLLDSAARGQRSLFIAVIWSAKESALKALRTGLRNDTHCVSVRVSEVPCPTSPNVGGRLPAALNHQISWRQVEVTYADEVIFHGCWSCKDNLVRTLVSIPTVITASHRRLGDFFDAQLSKRQ